MELRQWFAENWFILLQSAGIVGGLIFTAASLQVDAKVRRVQNLLTLTEHHRSIWEKLYERPELSRLLSKVASDAYRSPTTDEEVFVNLVILHLSSVYHAMKQGMFIKPEGLRRDIRQFFTLPIPRSVWQKMKDFQDRDFVKFVEAATGM